ncbi:interleukin-1 receptor-associated kinase 3 [Tachysurus fulvidraco]|uniref:interleukin-1 receptor-associated kinase 3 n=1 Tax=Tachysurus fulvidraco TaxID=1234273 RepID=UPI001FEE5859|nr:interleukin-1 receptor-associated kinase 3 [Tachysurus fulvidraco]XP_047660007.1 interleukin-1 receptor-associated kinase 3 [Tachysurus fulvidraco]
MSGKLEPSMYLFDVPPLVMETFCKVMDSGFDSLGWRGLAARILPSWLEVRCTEMHVAAGRSPTHELLWSWAQQNKTLEDLMRVLEDMGHHRALDLFRSHGAHIGYTYKDTPHASLAQNISKPQSHDEEPRLSSDPKQESVFGEGRRQKALITYLEVKVGTRNFHQDMKIADSTFAEVYQGRQGNKSFAVKVFKQGNKKSWKDLWKKFKTEIEVLNFFDHPNILELWGCFSEDERYCLVYPFMSNGSLFHRLHNEESGSLLSWQQRLNIIKGTANAVHHLHTAQPCMVICGNITSSNILLDERLQPKLSDFGMARLRPHTVNQSWTITMDTGSRSNLAYLPEEYIRDGKLSVKLDIYSFGMVILETCTGKKVVQETVKQTLLRDELSLEAEEKGSVDACLCFLDSRAGEWPTAAALCLLRLGLECTNSRARVRPSMDNVLAKLSELLPLPFALDDCPRTLADMTSPSVPVADHRLSSSMPEEDDEPKMNKESKPLECSQSEVTFMDKKEHYRCLSSSSVTNGRREDSVVQCHQTECTPALDLYSSWPVECSCAAGAETCCEDCWANGFSHNPSFIPQDDRRQHCESTIENPAKMRLRCKIQLYNQGLLKTEELLSMTSD